MSRSVPVRDDEEQAAPAPSPAFQRQLDHRVRTRQRDVLTVGVLTPALLLGIIGGVLVLSQTFYPDPYVEPTAAPTVPAATRLASPTPIPVVVPIDTARLNAGLVDKPPPFDWPDLDGLKLQPDPGRPGEHADYVPELSDVDTRRLILASTVNIAMHTQPQFAQGATEELAKPYPLRARKQNVLDLPASTGYVPDDSVFGVVFAFSSYRVQIETVAAAPPIRASQRDDVEYNTLHLADHVARRLQEVTSSGRRTGPEQTAVHWRDHLARRLPFFR